MCGPLESGSLESGPLRVAPLRVAPLRVAPLRVAPLRVAPLRVGPLRVGPLRVGPLRVAPLRSGSLAMASQSLTHKRPCFAVVILFPNCPPTYKHKTASVILYYICILLEPLLFLNRLVHFYHAHTYTPGKCIV